MSKWAEVTVVYILPLAGATFGVFLFIWRIILEPSNSNEKRIHIFLVRVFTRWIDMEKIANRIRELKLIVSNSENLNIQSFIETHHCVYFPVVPKPNLSVIHLE